MSEVQSRASASRGRGSHRAGRGGFSSRTSGRTSTRHANGDGLETAPSTTTSQPSLDEQGEIGQLKKQYASQLSTLRELFPDWTDDDLVFACQETQGDLPDTVERISEGNVSRFADVKKKSKEKPRPKPKESAPAADAAGTTTRARSRPDSTRGGRARGAERGRGSIKGERGGHAAAAKSVAQQTSVPTAESPAWAATATGKTSWSEAAEADAAMAAAKSTTTSASAAAIPPSAAAPKAPAARSWAMVAKPPKPAVPKAAVPRPLTETNLPGAVPVVEGAPDVLQPAPAADLTDGLAPPPGIASDPALQLTPPQDKLTEDNLEHVPDLSGPPPTETVASTRDPRSTVGTPYGPGSVSSQQTPIGRPTLGGLGAGAGPWKGMGGRNASFQRKILEQQEAVVMPGNHAVDRAAVQFGSMGLNGGDDANIVEADDDREEPETRAQPPQQSPAAPRASLPPPSHHQTSVTEPAIPPGIAPPKQAGHPPGPAVSQQPGLGSGGFGQYGRYAATQPEQATAQKPQDAFSQQYSGGQDAQTMYGGQSQAPSQPHLAGLSSGSNDYPSYGAGEHQRNAYQSYYGSSYGQQGHPSQQDATAARSSSGGFGGAASDTLATSQAPPAAARYGESQNSGHATPNPPAASQPHVSGPPSQQGHMAQQQHGQGGHAGGYPYANPYYGGNGYYGGYSNQYPNQYNYSAQGYGAYFGGKNNMYGQPHHGYGASPQASYEHSSSPANTSGFGSSSMHGRDSGFSSSLNEFGRSGSTQPSQGGNPSSTTGGYGDSLGRSSSGFASQNQAYGQSNLASGGEDSLKPYQDQRGSNAPGLSQNQPGRPGSAANSAGNASSSQSGYPASQSQQGFGGYPSHVNPLHNNPGSGYGSLGGLGGHQGGGQSHQGGNYGNYGGFSNSYGSYGRGGWGNNYTH